MRKVWLNWEDFELFHTDITPFDYEFFRTHNGAFKRMWQEQRRQFWSVFVSTFEYFIWNYGILKDFPMKTEEIHEYVDEILFYIRDQFVDGKVSSAKALVMDCVIVTQNRQCIALLDKISYSQNPFYMKETREVFRNLFGPPNSKRSFMKVLCGLPVYIKFAGAAVMLLRRWLDAPDVPSDDESISRFFRDIHIKKSNPPISYETLLAMKARSLMHTSHPALEAPPLLEKKESKDAADAKKPGRSKKTASDTSQKSKKTKTKTKAQSEDTAAPTKQTDEQADKDTVSQKEKPPGEKTKEPLGEETKEPLGEGAREPLGEGPKEPLGEGAKEPLGEGPKEPLGEGAKEPLGEGAKETLGEGAKEPLGEGAKKPLGEGAKGLLDTGDVPEDGHKGSESGDKDSVAGAGDPGNQNEGSGAGEEVPVKKKKKKRKRRKKKAAAVLEEEEDLLGLDEEVPEERKADMLGLDEDLLVAADATEWGKDEVADIAVVTGVSEGREDEMVSVPRVSKEREDKMVGVPGMMEERVGVPGVSEGREDEMMGVPGVMEEREDEMMGVPGVMEEREDEMMGVPRVSEGRGDKVVDVTVTGVMGGKVDEVPEVMKKSEDKVMDVPVVTEVTDIPEEWEEGVVENVLGLDEDVPLLPEEEKGEGAEEEAQSSEVRPEVSLQVAEEGDGPEVGGAPREERGEEVWVPSREEEVERSIRLEEEEAVEDGEQFASGELKSEVESSSETENREIAEGTQVQTELDCERSTSAERSGETEEKEAVEFKESESVEAIAESAIEQVEVADESEKPLESPEAEFDNTERSSALEKQSTEVKAGLGIEICDKIEEAVVRSSELSTEKDVEKELQPETPPPTVDPVDEEEEPVAKQEEAVAKGSSDREESLEPGKRRLHVCAFCGTKETSAKSFKRCQKCRGKSNPRYYCSRDCQVKHWKTHKLDHKTNVMKTAEN